MAYSPKGPFRLVTVNNNPERAQRLIGRVVADLKDRYAIDYVGNCIGTLNTSDCCWRKNLIRACRPGGG